MPLISLLKRLVGGDSNDLPPPAAARAPAGNDSLEIREEAKDSAVVERAPLPPPPPMSKAFSLAGPSATQSTTSMASLRSQVESERKCGLAASASYRNFTEGGHADGGHWNDPPTVVFKAQQLSPATPSSVSSVRKEAVSPPSQASSFVLVDEAASPSAPADTEAKEEARTVDVPEDRQEQEKVASRLLRKALDSVPLDSAPPMAKRMVEDTAKRLALLDERLPELDAAVVHSVCSIAVLIDGCRLGEALAAHRDLLQAGFDAELKWLVGLKRLIELQPKSSA
ncbi:hypothetical protein IWW37_005566 [Coemansia sp. RSA 2050]|nr:hypothetical protein IWW37_005566 [Coemansia sp. RSA 2050]KAJ2730193.1 hypothetical protein IW152_005348 [Coemansia sp. BCRC 34962]